MDYQAGEISLIELLNNEIAALYMSEQCSDITLYVEGQKIPAHRSIIGARCEYLKTDFSNEPNQTEFELDVPLEAFQILLKYFYTGKMSLSKINSKTVINILNLVEEYCLFYLKPHFENFLKQKISVQNSLQLLEVAKTYDLKELKFEIMNFIDTNADQILASESFKKIHKDLLEEILNRNTFNASSELLKFHAIEEWSKQANQNIETVIHLVDLSLIPLEELLRIGKSGTLTKEKIFDAIEKQMATKSTPSSDIQSIGQLPGPNENVASLKYNVRTLQGSFEQDGEFKYGHMIGDGSVIVIELGKIFIINHLKMGLTWQRRHGYFIEISTDQKIWERIIDYSSFNCRSIQNLSFPSKPVKYVKIVGTFPLKDFFKVFMFEAYYRENIPEIRNGIVVPKQKVTTDYSFWFNKNFIIRLDQPYYISSMSFEIDKILNIKYKYIIKTSLNYEDWEEVADKRDEFVNGLQSFRFTSKPIVYIDIIQLDCNIDGGLDEFRIKCFECPSSIEFDDIL